MARSAVPTLVPLCTGRARLTTTPLTEVHAAGHVTGKPMEELTDHHPDLSTPTATGMPDSRHPGSPSSARRAR